MTYNWQQHDWPNFRYDLSSVQESLLAFAEKTGHAGGVLKALPHNLQLETVIQLMVTEAIKSSEIEGEYLSREDVISSIRNNLGLESNKKQIADKRARGIAELLTDIRNTHSQSLSQEKLFSWHKMLMKGAVGIAAGKWRRGSEPMQVVSGSINRPIVHFEAPPSGKVPFEMKRFIKWFNQTAADAKHEIKPAVVRSAVAHLYFESIHPFEDGNGRIGRALSEKVLSSDMGRPVVLSLSKAIQQGKKEYYTALERAQRSNEITGWIEYFVNVALVAQEDAEKLIDFVLLKARLFDRYREKLTSRQLKVVNRMLQDGPANFEGGMSTRKYVSLTGIARATATRDLQELEELGIFVRIGAGRSTRYQINFDSV